MYSKEVEIMPKVYRNHYRKNLAVVHVVLVAFFYILIIA
jgi:hypothetical protein